MVEKEKRVAVIVANYNGVNAVYKDKCLLDWIFPALKRTNYKNMKVIMADDRSPDNSVEYTKKKYPWVDICVTKENGLFAKNANNGTRHAMEKYNPDYIVQLNTDLIIEDRDWLKKMIKNMESMDAGISCCLLVYPDGTIQHAGVDKLVFPDDRARHQPVTEKYTKLEYVNAVVFAAGIIKREVIDKIGYFDEKFAQGFEDTDYCVRALNAGFKVLYDGTVRITHLEGFTSALASNASSTVKKSGVDRWFATRIRNCVYYHHKHFNNLTVNTEVVFYTLGSCFFTTASGHMQVRDHIPERLGIWWKSYNDAKKLF